VRSTSGRDRGRKRWPAALIAVVGGAVLAAAPATAAASAEPLVIGGHDATEDYPFMTSLQVSGKHNCGGSLIRPDWVVTAAHCAAGGDPSALTVRVGSKDRTAGGSEAQVSQIVTHPGYDPSGAGNDIALLKLDHPVPQKPIRIAAEAGGPGTATRIVGWGKTCDDRNQCPDLPITLQELDTKLVADDQCTKFDGNTELCTDSDIPDAQGCNGDSGGPQLKGRPGDWELIGATSRDGDEDPKCATGPGIWTDVTSYTDWVGQVTGS
jgi:secreted trypsin-like serine protease